MLTWLLITGILTAELQPGTGALTAPAERLVTIPRVQSRTLVATGSPLGAQRFLQPFDPSDHSEFAVDFSPLLDEGETIADIEYIGVSASGSGLGVQIDTADDSLPRITDDDKHVQYWLLVDSAQWAAIAYDVTGTLVQVKSRIVTSKGRRYERSVVHEVRQL